MAVRFAESGGQYHQSNALGPGIWASCNASIVNNGVSTPRNGSTWTYSIGSAHMTTNAITPQSGLITGAAMYLSAATTATLIAYTLAGNAQCDLRMNSGGQLFFTRNGTTIGSVSTASVSAGAWHYFEFKALFATGATGTCEVYVDGALFLTASSVQNATTTATADQVTFSGMAAGSWGMDFYLLDTSSGSNTTYLGDVTVAELYPNAVGSNAAWSVQQGSFTLTAAANASGGTTVYTGTITNGATPTNAWQGYYFTTSGFTNGANNGTFLCTASTATNITLANASGVAETHAGTCAFQNPLQVGIHGGIDDGYATTNTGTRPPTGNQYIFSSTSGQKTDYAHTALALTGTIAAVVHMTNAFKDDAGLRQIQQICISGGTEEDSATISLPTSYQYFADILENDPHTAAAWTLSGLNAATFGVKEIT
jgi:hypothetical protein